MRRLPSLKAWQTPGEQWPAHHLGSLGPDVLPHAGGVCQQARGHPWTSVALIQRPTGRAES
jgi:hypothetical protein